MPLPLVWGAAPSALYATYVTLLRLALNVGVVLSLLVAGDRIVNIAKYAALRARAYLTGRLPQEAWTFAALPEDPAAYPRVAVQLPMFNERAVCQAIIDCCAELAWPASRLRIQVLDDSTDEVTRSLVDDKVLEWRERGVDVECLRRTNRAGYKAGAMKEGMDSLVAAGFAYVAVFDADFKPEPGFLARTIPYLEGNPTLGYVQSRWVFTNPQESYLTKAQEVSLNYHMKCEQVTHSATGSFFNFNGTAGVWRSACIQGSGGWLSRTTVEDMDLSLRAYLKGWKALFLDDVTCLNELPASFFAFRKQQHRWTCGPAQLASKARGDIWASALPLPRKLELLVLYFGIRKCATHFVSLGLFCTLVPLTMFSPEVDLPIWALIHVPVAVTLVTAAFTKRGWVYSILYVLFENAMGIVKLWAVLNGILDLQRAQEWVVTTKLGSSDKRPGTAGTGASGLTIPSCRLYPNELAFALWLLTAGTWGLLAGAQKGMALYLIVQGTVFFAFGLNWVDAGGLLGGRLDEDVVRVPVKASGGGGALGLEVGGRYASMHAGTAAHPARAHTLGSPPTHGSPFLPVHHSGASAPVLTPLIPLPPAAREAVKRSATIPVIRLDAHSAHSRSDSRLEEGDLPGGSESLLVAPSPAHSPALSAGARLAKIFSAGSMSILDTYSAASSASPTSSGARTPDAASGDDSPARRAILGDLPAAATKLAVRYESPDSTLSSLYSSVRPAGLLPGIAYRLSNRFAGAGAHND